MFTPKGKFGWYELMTSDTKAAGEFYSKVVGWTTQEVSAGDNYYTTFNIGGTGIAGLLNLSGHTAWIGYISVDDVDAHIEKIVEAGGKLLRPATDVPGMLRFAVVSDPQGAAFVVFTPNPAMPSSPERPAPPTAGTIGWHELHTTDLEGGFEFYHKLFGWTKVNDMEMGPMGTYRVFDEGEHKPMGDGGMMTKAPHIPVSNWTFYFCVDSINAAVERVNSGGGKVINGPMQVPGGGWIIQGQDPRGAIFSLIGSQE